MGTTPPPCDAEVFRHGAPLLAADTWTNALVPDGPEPRATGFEEWVRRIRSASGQRVDWHYSGGRAQVLFLGDREAIVRAIEADPSPAQILCWFGPGEAGLYRKGVSDPRPGGW